MNRTLKFSFFYASLFIVLISVSEAKAADWYESLEAPTLDYAAKIQNLNKHILITDKDSGRLPLDRAVVTAQIERAVQQEALYGANNHLTNIDNPSKSYTTIGIGNGPRE